MGARSESGLNPNADAASKAQDASRAKQYDRDLIARAAEGDIRAFAGLVLLEQMYRGADAAKRVMIRGSIFSATKPLMTLSTPPHARSIGTRPTAVSFATASTPGGATADHTDLSGAPEEWLPTRAERDPFASLDRARLVEAMQRCLDELPPHHRTAIILREVEGMSYEEIAEAMEVPKGTVMSRLFHARRKMQRMLREHFGDEVPKTAEERDGEEAT